MGFTVKIEQINNRSIIKGLDDLSKKEFPAKFSWNIARIRKQLMQVNKELIDSFDVLVKKYSVKDEKGALVHPIVEPEQKDENGKVIKEAVTDNQRFVIIAGKEEEYAKEMHDFMQSESPVIESHKIKLSEILNYDIKAETLTLLESIIEDDSEQPKKLELV